MTNKNIEAARVVANDQELAEGVFRLGAKYYVRTPTYAYVGKLVAVTPMVYVLEDSETVFESGTFKDFFSGKAADSQPHEGSSGECVIDRAGAVLVRFR